MLAETVLELASDWLQLFIERVVHLVVHGVHVLLLLGVVLVGRSLHVLLGHLLLLVDALEEAFLVHLDAVFGLQFFSIVIEEGFVSGHFVSDWQKRDLIQSHFCSHLFERKEELFGDIENCF